MKNILPFLLIIAFLCCSASADIQEQVTQEMGQLQAFNPTQLQKLRSTQFILIDGFFGDRYKSNFLPAQNLIQTQWSNSDVVIIRPDTSNPVEQNAEILYQQISDLRAKSPNQQAVVVAHSKGALEVLLMAIRHPDLTSKLGIKTFDLVSGPVQGTDIASLLEGPCDGYEMLCGYINARLPSIQSFTPGLIQPEIKAALDNLGFLDRIELQQKLFFVQTQMSNTDYTSSLFFPHLYLERHDPANPVNDGLIPTSSEVLLYNGKPFGTDLGVMHGDHNSLLNETSSASDLNYRDVFFHVLIEQTYLK
jgi:pimeloyl-ACP methyl ester carboxylesterase